MTTIAFKDGVMAADSEESAGHQKFPCEKLFRVKGAIIGTSGDSYNGAVFVRWYGDRRKPKPREDSEYSFECMVAKQDGVELWSELLCPVPVKAEFVAIGSGASVALGAMAAGASAEEAVQIACRYAQGTGGEVKTMSLK